MKGNIYYDVKVKKITFKNQCNMMETGVILNKQLSTRPGLIRQAVIRAELHSPCFYLNGYLQQVR